MTPRRAAALAAALAWACSGFATADEAPVCPPDLGITEPIGVCARDGNGPIVLEDPTVDTPDPAPQTTTAHVSAPAAPVTSTPTYTG